MKWPTGLVVLSADPITFGHLDLIGQALMHCADVIVLVTVNLEKEENYLFSLEARGEMAARAISQCFSHQKKHIRVICGRYRVVEIYKEYRCSILVRGLRTENERSHEKSILAAFQEEYPDISYILLPTRAGFSYISSTKAKQAATLSLEHALQYVPYFVATRLIECLRAKEKSHAAQ